ncbi:hypothetical protein Trydic_g12767 [Trypoxylus dichotomus]
MNLGRPDLELLFILAGLSADHGMYLKDMLKLRNQIWDNYFSQITNYFIASILPIVFHPKSVGAIRLKDTDPSTMPIIKPNYFSHPSDIDILIKGIRFVKGFVEMPAMQKLGARFNNLTFPGCEGFEFDTDEHWHDSSVF